MNNKSNSIEAKIKAKPISAVINPRLVQANPNISLKMAIQIMRDNRAGYIVLAENKKAVGMFTEVDVTRRILTKGIDLEKPVRDFMTQNPFVLNPEDTVEDAMKLMGAKKFYHIPLINEKNELTGVLSVRSLIRFMAEFYPTEVFNLPPNPDQIMGTQEGG